MGIIKNSVVSDYRRTSARRVRYIAWCVAVIAVVALSSGCARREGGAVVAYDPGQEYTITMGVYGDLERAYNTVINSADFKATFPNITVELQTTDFNGHHQRLTTIIAAGEETLDIEALEVAFIALFVEGGGLRDLSASPFNGNEITDQLVPFAVSNATTKDGQLVAMPVDIAPAVFFYREDLATASGVSVEEMENIRDWDHFIEIGYKLTRDTDGDGEIDQWAIPHANDAALIPLNGGKGGWFDEQENPLQPEDKFKSSLELVSEIRAAGIDADLAAWSGPWVESFKSGVVVGNLIGAWFGGALKTWIAPEVTDWRVAYLPGRSPASVGGTYLSIPNTSNTERAAAAWEVLTYLVSSPESQLSVFREIDAYPALVSVYDDPVMEEGVDYFGGQQARLIYADVAQSIPEKNVTPNDQIASSIWGNAVALVITEGVGIDEAYAQAQDQILASIE